MAELLLGSDSSNWGTPPSNRAGEGLAGETGLDLLGTTADLFDSNALLGRVSQRECEPDQRFARDAEAVIVGVSATIGDVVDCECVIAVGGGAEFETGVFPDAAVIVAEGDFAAGGVEDADDGIHLRTDAVGEDFDGEGVTGFGCAGVIVNLFGFEDTIDCGWWSDFVGGFALLMFFLVRLGFQGVGHD